MFQCSRIVGQGQQLQGTPKRRRATDRTPHRRAQGVSQTNTVSTLFQEMRFHGLLGRRSEPLVRKHASYARLSAARCGALSTLLTTWMTALSTPGTRRIQCYRSRQHVLSTSITVRVSSLGGISTGMTGNHLDCERTPARGGAV